MPATDEKKKAKLPGERNEFGDPVEGAAAAVNEFGDPIDAAAGGARTGSSGSAGVEGEPPPETPGTLRGLINTAKAAAIQSIQASDVKDFLERAERGPTARQQRAAFEQALSDPAYTAALGEVALRQQISEMFPDDEELRGKVMAAKVRAHKLAPGGRLDEMRFDQEQDLAARGQAIARRQEKLDQLLPSQAYQDFLAAEGYAAAEALSSDPIEVMANITLQGLTGSLSALVSGAAGGAIAGPGGQATGAGYASLSLEYAASIMESARAEGVDFREPDSLRKLAENPDKLRAIRAHAFKRAVPIAVFDFLTAGIAGRVAPKMHGLLPRLFSEPVTDAVGSGTGEAIAQFVSGDPFSFKDIFMEAAGEVGMHASQAGVNRVFGPRPAAAHQSQTVNEFGDPVVETAETIQGQQEVRAALEALAGEDVGKPRTDGARQEVMGGLVKVARGHLETGVDSPQALAQAMEVPRTPLIDEVYRQAAGGAVQATLPAEVDAQLQQIADIVQGRRVVVEKVDEAVETRREEEEADTAGEPLDPSEFPTVEVLEQEAPPVPALTDPEAPGDGEGLAPSQLPAAAAAEVLSSLERTSVELENQSKTRPLAAGVRRAIARIGSVIRSVNLSQELNLLTAEARENHRRMLALNNQDAARVYQAEIEAYNRIRTTQRRLGRSETDTAKSEAWKEFRSVLDRILAHPPLAPSAEQAGRLGMNAIWPDPKGDAARVFDLYKALHKLARIYIKDGMRSAKEFADRLGYRDAGIVRRAFEDAARGRELTKPEELPAETVRQVAGEVRERKFSIRFDDDDRIDQDIRDLTGNRTYARISNELTAAEALGVLDEIGMAGAIGVLKDENNGLEFRVRVVLAQAIILRANQEYQRSKAGPMLDVAVDTAEWLTEYGTRLGQGVQAFQVWAHLTPDAYVRAFQKAVQQNNQVKRPDTLSARRPDPRPPATPGSPPIANPVPGPPKAPDEKPRLSKKLLKEIHKRAADALSKPEGFQRDEAIIDVLGFMAQESNKKGAKFWEIATALWYANILSGVTTQVRNFAGTLSNLLLEIPTHAAIQPRAVPQMLAGLYNGMIRGFDDALNILKTGKVTGTRLTKLEVPRVLEMVRFKGVAKPLNAWKYVFRVMAATDMVFFRSAEEMRARFLARTLAREEGLSGTALSRRMAEILHNTPAIKAAARQRAIAEGLTGVNLRRREAEIIEQTRPRELVADSAEYGRRVTFNQTPSGCMGYLARGANKFARVFPPFRLVVPFTTVVANVTNVALDFTPWGYTRLFNAGNFPGELAPEWGSTEYKLQAARATLGTVGLTALFAMAMAAMDDEDPWFTITASGPREGSKRRQLRESGWQPFSIKLGKRWWSYQYSAPHLGLAIVGHVLDAIRYRNLNEQEWPNRLAYALNAVPNTVLSQSFLVGLADLFRGMSQDSIPKDNRRFRFLARSTSSIVVPNLFKQIDRIFDPRAYESDHIAGALVQDVPVARQLSGLNEVINVLGEPIKKGANPFWSVERRDRVWNLIAEKQAWISEPARDTMIGDRQITPQEYYRYVRTSGRAIRRRLLGDAVYLQKQDAETVQAAVRKIVREERSRAKRILFGVKR